MARHGDRRGQARSRCCATTRSTTATSSPTSPRRSSTATRCCRPRAPRPAGDSCPHQHAGRRAGCTCGAGRRRVPADRCSGAKGHAARVPRARRLAPARRRAGAATAASGTRRSAAATLGWLDPRDRRDRARSRSATGSAPHGVIVGPDGAPWITDGGLNAIVRVDPRTREVQGFPLPADRAGANLNTAVFDRDGHALVHRPERASTAGSTRRPASMRVFDAPGGPRPVRHHGHARRRRLLRLARRQPHRPRSTSTPARRRASSRRRRARARAASGRTRSGRIWVSEWNAGQVGVYDPATDALARVAAARRRAAGLRRLRRRARHRLAHRLRRQRDRPLRPAHRALHDLPARRRPARTCASSSAGPGEVWGAESGLDRLVVARSTS